MKWARTLIRRGFLKEEVGNDPDPFQFLGEAANSSPSGIAELEFNLRTSTDYGQISCSVSLRIRCPQNEPCIDLAGEIGYRKALELVNAGASQAGTPPLPPFEEPR